MKEECAAGICGLGGGEGRCGSRNEIQEVKEVKEAKTVHHRDQRALSSGWGMRTRRGLGMVLEGVEIAVG
jgi:hypothetical protein